MSLTALQHSFIATDRPAANTVEGWLNNIYDACNGNMTNWTCSRYQNVSTTEAVYFEPTGGQAAADGLRVIFAGVDSGSPTPPMAIDTSFNTAYLYAGVAYNGGAFNAWDAASPFTSGEFSGYIHIGRPLSQVITSMQIGETAETILYQQVDIDRLEGGSVVAGAIIDAESTDPSNSINGDGRVFGIIGCGYQNQCDFNNLGSQVDPWTHGTGSSDTKAVYLKPNGTTWSGLSAGPNIQGTDRNLKQRDGSPWIAPIFFHELNSPYRMVGRLREIGLGPYALNRDQMYGAGNTAVAMLWATFDNSATCSVALKY